MLGSSQTPWEQAHPQELAAQSDPIGPRFVTADAVGAESFVFPAADLFGVAARQHVGDVLQAGGETAELADAENTTEELPAFDGGIVGLARREAGVTTAAVERRV